MQNDEDFTICSLFRSQSREIWERIKFSREQRIRCDETTITQNFIFQFWYFAKQRVLPITIYEAKDENTNGADIEILLETPAGYLLIAAQAKITKPNGRYYAITHNSGTPQIDLLLRYAYKRGGLASYMLYNYSREQADIATIESFTGLEIENFGCTLASAALIKNAFFIRGGLNKWAIPSFEKIHPFHAVPFYWLICSFLTISQNTTAILEQLGYDMENLRYYAYEELADDGYWKNMLPPAAIGRTLLTDREEELTRNDNAVGYNPKYRIVLSREISGGLYSVD